MGNLDGEESFIPSFMAVVPWETLGFMCEGKLPVIELDQIITNERCGEINHILNSAGFIRGLKKRFPCLGEYVKLTYSKTKGYGLRTTKPLSETEQVLSLYPGVFLHTPELDHKKNSEFIEDKVRCDRMITTRLKNTDGIKPSDGNYDERLYLFGFDNPVGFCFDKLSLMLDPKIVEVLRAEMLDPSALAAGFANHGCKSEFRLDLIPVQIGDDGLFIFLVAIVNEFLFLGEVDITVNYGRDMVQKSKIHDLPKNIQEQIIRESVDLSSTYRIIKSHGMADFRFENQVTGEYINDCGCPACKPFIGKVPISRVLCEPNGVKLDEPFKFYPDGLLEACTLRPEDIERDDESKDGSCDGSDSDSADFVGSEPNRDFEGDSDENDVSSEMKELSLSGSGVCPDSCGNDRGDKEVGDEMTAEEGACWEDKSNGEIGDQSNGEIGDQSNGEIGDRMSDEERDLLNSYLGPYIPSEPIPPPVPSAASNDTNGNRSKRPFSFVPFSANGVQPDPESVKILNFEPSAQKDPPIETIRQRKNYLARLRRERERLNKEGQRRIDHAKQLEEVFKNMTDEERARHGVCVRQEASQRPLSFMEVVALFPGAKTMSRNPSDIMQAIPVQNTPFVREQPCGFSGQFQNQSQNQFQNQSQQQSCGPFPGQPIFPSSFSDTVGGLPMHTDSSADFFFGSPVDRVSRHANVPADPSSEMSFENPLAMPPGSQEMNHLAADFTGFDTSFATGDDPLLAAALGGDSQSFSQSLWGMGDHSHLSFDQ